MNWTQLLSSSRWEQKTAPNEPSRSAFEQDYDRIIFSHPFRRLQDKTQVHPLPEHDFVHTRLTHSLEVSSVGRSLGRKVGEAVIDRHKELRTSFTPFDLGAITAAAALAHDLGNPPFGHAGEDALSDFFQHHPYGRSFRESVSDSQWEELLRFEGNAQGFRILNKNRYGLKLTFATLGAFTKYPCTAFTKGRDATRRSQKKFGFFLTEQGVFEKVASQLGLIPLNTACWSRHPLAFLVEAADDICYSIIDLEDGCSLGLVSYEEALALFERIITRSRTKLGKLDQLNDLHERIGYLRALAIGDLMDECVSVFLDQEQEILDGKFDHALADHCASQKGLRKIIDVSIEKIYKARKVVEIEAAGHEVLPGLMEEFLKAGISLAAGKTSGKYGNLQKLFPAETRQSIGGTGADHYSLVRHVIDFISGLTDRHAISLFRKIRGFEV